MCICVWVYLYRVAKQIQNDFVFSRARVFECVLIRFQQHLKQSNEKENEKKYRDGGWVEELLSD